MAFDNKRSDEGMMSEINVTPLVDVMLVLLVVFIVTAPLLTQSVRVTLPKTESAATSPQDHVVSLSVDKDGQVFVGPDAVGTEALADKLKALQAKDPEMILQFNADSAVNYGKVAEVMAIAQHIGITKLSFLTQSR